MWCLTYKLTIFLSSLLCVLLQAVYQFLQTKISLCDQKMSLEVFLRPKYLSVKRVCNQLGVTQSLALLSCVPDQHKLVALQSVLPTTPLRTFCGVLWYLQYVIN